MYVHVQTTTTPSGRVIPKPLTGKNRRSCENLGINDIEAAALDGACNRARDETPSVSGCLLLVDRHLDQRS